MPQDLILDAKLNKDSYSSNNTAGGVSNLGGWVRFSVTRYELPAGSNFAAQLYQGPDGMYKIAFRGTVNPLGTGDAAMNAGIAGGQWTAEMSESIKFTFAAIQQIAAAENISFQAAKAKFSLTGHSQGGFEAELNAKFYGLGGTSLDGPGASPLIGVAGWNAMKDWARAQEPGVQQSHDIGDFMARRYPFQKYGVLEGTVQVVSADSSANDPQKAAALGQNPQSYKALVRPASQELRAPNGEVLKLAPGMVVQAEIHQGRRTVLEYLLSPVQKVAQEAGRER